MEYVFRSIYPKLNTQSRFLKKICCRILSSGDSFWAICGYISLIINSSECYSRTKQFILFVATRRILILFNCHTSDNFFVNNALSPWRKGGSGPYPSPTFSESTLPVCYAGNLLLCHSPKHPKLIWPRQCQNLVGDPVLVILIF